MEVEKSRGVISFSKCKRQMQYAKNCWDPVATRHQQESGRWKLGLGAKKRPDNSWELRVTSNLLSSSSIQNSVSSFLLIARCSNL